MTTWHSYSTLNIRYILEFIVRSSLHTYTMLILSGLQRAVSLDVACRLKQRSFVWAHASYGGRLLSLFCDQSASGAGVADLDEGDQDAASEEGEFYS